MFNRILVPTDFSPPSEAALEYAKAVATRFGATLHLLHVVDDPYRTAFAAEMYVPELEGMREALVADAVGKLNEGLRASDLSDLGVSTAAVVGMPASSIVDYAWSHHADLIIMGTHGRSGVSHLLIGSVAERVVRTAPCPVLTVRETAVVARAKTTNEVAMAVPPALMATGVDGEC